MPPRLVGRAAEDASIRRLLLDPETRLVTLTGPAGVGKSALSAAVVHELAGAVVPVFLVDLATVPDVVHVPSAVALAITGDASGDAVGALADGRAFLLLDNFEHVLAAAPFVERLAGNAGDSRVLVTSRRRLDLDLEREVAVPPLGIAAGSRLFMLRARAARPTFRLTPEVERQIARSAPGR